LKCPQCNGEMLKAPILNSDEIMEYFLCIDCNPYVRILKRCKWQEMRSGIAFCNLNHRLCNVNRCPQIREWKIKSASWVADALQKST